MARWRRGIYTNKTRARREAHENRDLTHKSQSKGTRTSGCHGRVATGGDAPASAGSPAPPLSISNLHSAVRRWGTPPRRGRLSASTVARSSCNDLWAHGSRPDAAGAEKEGHCAGMARLVRRRDCANGGSTWPPSIGSTEFKKRRPQRSRGPSEDDDDANMEENGPIGQAVHTAFGPLGPF